MKRTVRGFTIVELMVVIGIIGVLTTLGFISFNSIQSNVRDSQRASRVKIISEALEKYYDKNGEYPSCSAMAQTPNTVVGSTLIGLDPNVLATPTASSGSNSILPLCTDLTSGTDGFAYIGDGSNSCLTGSACLQYSLKYKEEGSGSIISTASRRTVSLAGAPAKPIAPTMSISLVNNTVVAVINPITCATGTPQYGVSTHVNEGSWSDFSSWDPAPTITAPTAVQGYKYEYKAQARCWASTFSYSTNSTGSTASYVQPITDTPLTPTVIATTANGNWLNTTFSWNTTSCPTGTSARYKYDYTTSWGFDYGWLSWPSTSVTWSTSDINYTYTTSVKTQCYNSYYPNSAPWSGIGSVSYTRNPITTPNSPVVIATTNDWQNTNFSWYPVTCSSGTTVRYTYDSIANSTGNPSYSDPGWTATTNTYSPTVVSSTFGVKHSVYVKAQCYNAYSSSDWSVIGAVDYTRNAPSVDILVVAGGGSGGNSNGGGGGGGGVISTSLTLGNRGYTLHVGNGGGGVGQGSSGNNGGDSTFDTNTLVAKGGGGGGKDSNVGLNGGSGGGGGGSSTDKSGGSGTSGQGTSGGKGMQRGLNQDSGGGGGGANQSGGDGYTTSPPGKMNGGAGKQDSTTGSIAYYGGGGGGGGDGYRGDGSTGSGGGGGGDGNGINATSGTANTGGGGGGAGSNQTSSGSGGSGIVVIRYITSQMNASFSDGVSVNSGIYTIVTFNSVGDHSFTVAG